MRSYDKQNSNFTFAHLWNFWQRRWYRTLPNYFLFLIVALLVEKPDLESFSLLPYFFFLQNFAAPITPFYTISWSLTVEEWFYLTFPLTVWLLLLLTKRKGLTLGLAMLLTIIAATYFRFQLTGEDWDGTTRKIVLGRLDSLQIGVLLAVLERYRNKLWKKIQPFALVLILLFVWAMLAAHIQYSQEHHPFHPAFIFTLFPLGSAGVLLLLKDVSLGFVQPFVEWVSRISYSLYLAHLPVKNIVEYLLGDPSFGLQWLFIKGLTVALIFLVSHLTYKFVEMPFMRLRPKEVE